MIRSKYDDLELCDIDKEKLSLLGIGCEGRVYQYDDRTVIKHSNLKLYKCLIPILTMQQLFIILKKY